MGSYYTHILRTMTGEKCLCIFSTDATIVNLTAFLTHGWLNLQRGTYKYVGLAIICIKCGVRKVWVNVLPLCQLKVTAC